MMEHRVVYCCNCARQIVSYTVSNSRCVGPANKNGGCLMLVGSQVVCPECSEAERILQREMEEARAEARKATEEQEWKNWNKVHNAPFVEKLQRLEEKYHG
jgi:hypothetical protein